MPSKLETLAERLKAEVNEILYLQDCHDVLEYEISVNSHERALAIETIERLKKELVRCAIYPDFPADQDGSALLSEFEDALEHDLDALSVVRELSE